jgi:hypothetical protein
MLRSLPHLILINYQNQQLSFINPDDLNKFSMAKTKIKINYYLKIYI